jgi:hypothetical protein
MAAVDLVIGIGAEYKGKPAFNKADNATEKLTKNIRNLAGAIGIAFGTKVIFNFAKASLKASLASQAQQYRLAKLLTVTNGASAEQIDILTKQAETLENLGVVTAGSITQVQSQLATFDLQILTINKLTPAILDYVTAEKGAAATADDFKTATNGLAQALNGNFASLTKTGFVLDEATKKTISSGTESERAAAIVKVLDSTYKGFNRSLRDTPTGQFQILANSADNARVIIGDGLQAAFKKAFGGGDVQKATANFESFAQVIAGIIEGLGALFGWLIKIGQWSASNSNKAIAERERLANLPYDPRTGNLPDLSPAFMKLVREQKKLDASALKNDKARLASNKKLTAEMKKQAALKKAMKVLDTASKVFDIDLIQNLAALQGRITDDELLRLRTQQAILTDNEKLASKLSQQLLSTQIDAMILGNTDPFDAWTQGAIEALNAMIDLREELGKLTKPVLTFGQQLLANDFVSVLTDANNTSFADAARETSAAQLALDVAAVGRSDLSWLLSQMETDAALSLFPTTSTPSSGGSNFTYNQGNPLAVQVFVDPAAMAYGISAAVINNTANGNSNNAVSIKSYAGGA